MTLFEILADLEEDDDLHLSRLLILLRAFAERDASGTVDGLTKLAKLDFLLRYPVFLERALEARKRQRPGDNIKPVEEAAVKEHERHSVESAMVRFKFGPWDHRYRRFLNLLVAHGLASVSVQGRTNRIGLTPAGVAKADELAARDENADVAARTKVIRRRFDLAGTTLMKFVYDTFPEIVSLRLGEEIRHEN